MASARAPVSVQLGGLYTSYIIKIFPWCIQVSQNPGWSGLAEIHGRMRALAMAIPVKLLTIVDVVHFIASLE